jgi:aryl-alcohol dehydrogenase-like predicted oxidoreductase
MALNTVHQTKTGMNMLFFLVFVAIFFSSSFQSTLPREFFASALSSTSTSTQPKRIKLGTLTVSPMGFGTLNLPLDKTEGDKDTVDVVKAAHAAGINLIDTAEAYGFGRSEKLTKWAIEQAGLQVGQSTADKTDEEMAVATKFAPVPWRPGADSVVDACRASNERLGVEACDLYQSK